MIKSVNEYEQLFEIGDAKAKPFPWRFKKGYYNADIYYIANSDKHEYTIKFEEIMYHSYEFPKHLVIKDLNFYVKSSGAYLEATGANEVYQLMSTIIEISHDFVKRFPEVDAVKFWAIDMKTDARDIDITKGMSPSQRSKLYNEFLKKNIKKISKDAKIVMMDPNNYIVILKKLSPEDEESITDYFWEETL